MLQRLSILLVLLCIQTGIYCQIYNNNATFVVNPNENVYVQGDFTNQASGRLTMQGTIHLKGNWTNSAATASIITNATGGLVRMVGTTNQTIGGTSGTVFNNLEVANTAATPYISLTKDATVSQVLTFTSGKIWTNANNIIITNTATSAMVGYNSNRYIYGNLRRYFTGTTNSYDLPLGTDVNYELATIKFNAYTGITYLNSTFTRTVTPLTPSYVYPDPLAVYIYPDSLNPIANPTSYFMSKYSYVDEFLNYGYWTITPDAGSSSSYKLTLTDKGHSNGGTVLGQHAIVKRSAAGNWRAEGRYPLWSEIGSGNSDITVYMDQMSTFSDYIIGKSKDGWGPLGIVLLDFNAVCNDNIVNLTWTTSNENNNDHFVVERSLDLQNWIEATTVKGSALSHGNLSYNAVDASPFPGTSYYRLKQVDIDRTVTTYDNQWIKYVSCGTDGKFDVQIYHNGNHSVITKFLSSSEGATYKIEISDLLGRIVGSQNGIQAKGWNYITLPAPQGGNIYMVTFTSPEVTTTRKVFIPRD